MEDSSAVNNAEMVARSAGEPGLNHSQHGYVGNAPIQMMQDPHRNILAHDEGVKPIAPASQVYNHQNSCMHVGSPMFNSNINPRSCHYNHCQHRCPRSMNPAPMYNNNNNTMGFGNLRINTENPSINTSNPMMRHNFDNSHVRPVEQCCHYGGNRAYTPNPWHDNMAPANDVEHTPNQNEALLAAPAPAQDQLDASKQVKTIRFENSENVEAPAQMETARNEMSTNVDQNHNQQNQEQSSDAERRACDNHSIIQENTEHAHDTVEEEHCPNVNAEKFNQMEIKNKREISKGLTDDSAKSLIYFQGPESEYSKIERDQANISRSRRLNNNTGQVINKSSQNLVNLNQQPDPASRTIKSATKSDKTEEPVPADIPPKETKSCIANEKDETNNPPVDNRVQVAETADDGRGTGDNCDGNVFQNSESGFSFGDCFKLNLGAKITRKAIHKDETKRRNGLE